MIHFALATTLAEGVQPLKVQDAHSEPQGVIRRDSRLSLDI